MSVWGFDAIGTRWEIETETPLDEPERARVSAAIGSFDRTWSRFRDDSLVTVLAHSGGDVGAPADAAAMLEVYRELSDATDGAVNPLVGESLSALGYDAEVSLLAGEPRPAPADWTSILTWSGARLSVATPVQIDVGALGKGRLVDLVLAELGDVPGSVTVDGGGDIAVRGDEVRIGLEHPFDRTKAIGVASIRDQALCASATNRRAWGDGLHHVLDARTGAPVRTWAATWAIAPDAMHADAAATALFFGGGAELAARWGVEWVRMSTTGMAERSAECPVELFTTPGVRR
ncbi:FAD:protein FMN transferase [Microbacterium murale]|uniref:FAD:protein FMN transferase n=1 Tax=Microbacterium murale TaxID=1081040 RepID=A0ABU0P695_9MICO|nr:FAD:protein FMN transferase [Microbacterium murale]MDQ0642221.1 thiamine biosynthesis lipoprotein [Microbacterium murale]